MLKVLLAWQGPRWDRSCLHGRWKREAGEGNLLTARDLEEPLFQLTVPAPHLQRPWILSTLSFSIAPTFISHLDNYNSPPHPLPNVHAPHLFP